ncbi:hypothetical protein J2Z60_001543 [Lactobacillus colini]|uniref:ABC transporter permease n=1 Tax=Lactobacillus colini TaxID=1819254 RepID=A0ABS4MFC6_9LACO|nr:hypothetical protein [Lactobacillus colini]MBP2058364.1 hypothetical protein [Lactobacillus colini]
MLIKNELKRIFTLPQTWLALLIGIGIVIIQGKTIFHANAYFIDSAYMHLTGFDSTGMGTRLYTTILPLLAAMAGGVFEADKVSGLNNLKIVRKNRPNYYWSTLTSTFLVGGIIGTLPLILEGMYFFSKFSIKPIKPNFELMPIDKIGWGYQLFIHHPIIFWLLSLIIIFLFSGLFANIAVVTSYFDIKRGIEYIIPFLLVFLSAIARDVLGQEWLGIPSILTPTFSNSYQGTGYAIIAYFIIGMAVIVFLTIRKLKNDGIS